MSLRLSVSSLAILEIAFFGSEIALFTVGPLTKAIIGPNCNSPFLSHSQEVSLAGLPKVPRKPSGSEIPTSGKDAARVPAGTPGNFVCEPVTV